MKLKTIAVTGASGHIGNVVCRQLLEQGYEVRALYNSFDVSLADIAVQKFQGDVLNQEILVKFFTGCDVVINCAAIISIHGDPTGIVFKTNTEGPRNVLSAAIKTGIKKIVHVSSTHAVNETPLNEPFDETRSYKNDKSDRYDFSKATGEQTLLAHDAPPEIVVVRPSSVAGPFDFKPSALGGALLDFYNEKIPALPPGGYDFVDVRDVAKSIIAAMETGRHRDVFLLSGKYYTMKELSQLIHEVTNKKTPRVIVPFAVLNLSLPFLSLYGKLTGGAPVFTRASMEALKNGHRNMNNEKAKQRLGHICRPMRETLKDFYEWQKQRGVI